MITCPDCKGVGTVNVLAMTTTQGCKPMTRNCFRCKGAKEISEEMQTWIQQGEALRQNRIARDMNLSEEAKRLGIHPAELSQMEHGKIQPMGKETNG